MAHLRCALLAALLTFVPPALADTADYRTLDAGAPPEAPPAGEACSAQPFTVSCDPLGFWGLGMVGWAVDADPDAVAVVNALTKDAYPFQGPSGSTQALILLDDAVGGANVIFRVLGPAGQGWTCKRSCTVPTASLTVSIDPADVPPSVWAGTGGFPLPNLPVTSGTITVTFS